MRKTTNHRRAIPFGALTVTRIIPDERGDSSMTHRRMKSALIAARAEQARIERKRRAAQVEQDWMDSPIGDLSTVQLVNRPRRILRPVY